MAHQNADKPSMHMPMDYVSDDPTVSTAPRTVNTHKSDQNLITVQPLRKSELQPSYAQDLGLDNIEHGCYGSMINCLGAVAGTLGAIPICICCPNPYRSVNQGSVGLVSRFGQFYAAKDPGLVKINPFSESIRIVDVKIQVVGIPRQTVMTRDNVNVEIDSVIYFHIVNPYRACFSIGDVRGALIERAQSTLRHVCGSKSLQHIISDREGVAQEIEEQLASISTNWGVSIESLAIKDIAFSADLQASLSSAAQQKRIGESKVIAARAEVESAKLMREAADILSSPAAIQIRQLDALQNMARQSNSKVVFVPMSLMQASQSGEGSMQGGMLANTAVLNQMADM